MNEAGGGELSAKLRTWKVQPEVPTSFQRDVWHRIATRQAGRIEAFWPRTLRLFLHQLARPLYAVALIVLSISASLGVAHVQAREARANQWKVLEARYAASIDPAKMGN